MTKLFPGFSEHSFPKSPIDRLKGRETGFLDYPILEGIIMGRHNCGDHETEIEITEEQKHALIHFCSLLNMYEITLSHSDIYPLGLIH